MKEKLVSGMKRYGWIWALGFFLLLFPFLLEGIAGIIEGKIPHLIDADVWFGGLCSLVPTTVVAISTFYMTRRADLREEEYRKLMEQPRLIGTEFRMQVIVEKMRDKELLKEMRYKWVQNKWKERIFELDNSFWFVFSGKNLNNHILRAVEIVNVLLEIEGNKLEYEEDSFLQKVELYSDKEVDFTMEIACCLKEENLVKMKDLFSSYVKEYTPEVWVRCELKILDDMESEHVVVYQAKLKSGEGVLRYGAERQIFRIAEPKKNRENNRSSRT